jgi:hypothetical protein
LLNDKTMIINGRKLEPVFYKTFPGLGISDESLKYYVVYKVMPINVQGSLNKEGLNLIFGIILGLKSSVPPFLTSSKQILILPIRLVNSTP